MAYHSQKERRWELFSPYNKKCLGAAKRILLVVRNTIFHQKPGNGCFYA